MKNSRNEYCEKIKKDTSFRSDYYEGILSFLNEQKDIEEHIRQDLFSAVNYKQDPEKYRRKFLEMLGFPLLEDARNVYLKEKIFIVQDKNVNIYRLTLMVRDKIPFYGLYFEQIEDKDSAPFVIALHGGWGTPELIAGFHQDSSNYNHILRRITERGANVFAPQLLLWDVSTYGNAYMPRAEIDGKLRQLGGSITALESYCLQAALTYFIEKENINQDRIGTVGMSYGGMYALHLAAIDTRVKVCYSSSWLCNGFIYAWPDWCYKNAQKIASTVETAALICPRALVVAMGNKDNLFDYHETEKTCKSVSKFYQVFEQEENFKYIIFDGEHEIDKADDELNFFFKKI